MNTPTTPAPSLRQFGLLLALVICFWTGVLYLRSDSSLLAFWPGLSAAGLLILVALLQPHWLHGLHHYWMKAAHGLNRLLTRITLTLSFFVIITPVALIKRATGNNALAPRNSEAFGDSYRQPSAPIKADDMETPF
jgi:hypothetical protein